MICLVVERKAVDVVSLGFCKVFNTVSRSILLKKLADHGLKRYVDSWHKKPAELAQWPGIESPNEMS